MLTRTVYVVKLQTCNLGCRNPSAVGRIYQDQVKWISCMFSRGLLKNSMFCVLPVFHERELHLLNFEASDSFNGDFIRVNKIIINICTVVVFIISQYEIANFYWFIYLIKTFEENALYIYSWTNLTVSQPTLLFQTENLSFHKTFWI